MSLRDPIEILGERFHAAMRSAFGNALPPNADPLIAASRNPQFGDFQSNAAMPLGKALGLPPREVAERIIEHLDVSGVLEQLAPHIPPDVGD